MAELYSRLFRYRARENREPLEDFLSEALVDLLERFSPAQIEDFGSSVFFRESDLQDSWCCLIRGAREIAWSTQHGVADGARRGIVDILMWIDGHPALAIESKVGSSVRSHRENSDEADEAGEPTQLSTYGRWLGMQCKAWSGGLVFLTHRTPAPGDFLTHDVSLYGVPNRAVSKWSMVRRWLRRAEADTLPSPTGQVCSALAGELAAFIEENDMGIEGMTAGDVDVVQLFLPSSDRLQATITAMWEAGVPAIASLTRRKSSYEVYKDGGLIWFFQYLKPPLSYDSYAAVGVRFPRVKGYWSDADVPKQTYAFVLVGSEGGDLPVEMAGPLAEGWLRAEDEFLVTKALDLFAADPDQRLEQLEAWSRLQMAAAAALIKAMSRT